MRQAKQFLSLWTVAFPTNRLRTDPLRSTYIDVDNLPAYKEVNGEDKKRTNGHFIREAKNIR